MAKRKVPNRKASEGDYDEQRKESNLQEQLKEQKDTQGNV